MADKKITQLPEHIVDFAGTDLLLTVCNVATTPANYKVQLKNFTSRLTFDYPATTFSPLKIVANVAVEAAAAVLSAAEFITQTNSSINVAVQERYGLVVKNQIFNATANVTGRMAIAHFVLDTGNAATITTNTFGVVIEHTVNANAVARTVAPRAYVAIKERAGTGGTPTLYLFDIGAQGNTVSANLTTGNSSVLFSVAANTTLSHKLKITVNGTDYWIPLTPAF